MSQSNRKHLFLVCPFQTDSIWNIFKLLDDWKVFQFHPKRAFGRSNLNTIYLKLLNKQHLAWSILDSIKIKKKVSELAGLTLSLGAATKWLGKRFSLVQVKDISCLPLSLYVEIPWTEFHPVLWFCGLWKDAGGLCLNIMLKFHE